MACNAVPFQKGFRDPAFDRQYGIEEQYRALVIALRWPDRSSAQPVVVGSRGSGSSEAERRDGGAENTGAASKEIKGLIGAAWFRSNAHVRYREEQTYDRPASYY